jgi:4-phosphopantoate--beta-alanine ligase
MISRAHPRYESLVLRDKIVKASKEGYLADSAMIAHGRGEAFDYLLGEKTTLPAKRAMYVTVAMMILSKNPVISVNGNTTALAIDEIIEFAKVIGAKIEINLFYRTDERVDKLTKLYADHGYPVILGSNSDEIMYINEIKNPRASASKTGIYSADTVLVPLEDGDRAEILSRSGKNIITIDLNPLSRTSKMSDVSIVDNVVRAIPFMTKIARDLKTQNEELLRKIIEDFDNDINLKESLDLFKIKEEEK